MPEGWVCLAEGLAFPEGPCFAPDGRLWWVEIDGGCLGYLHDGALQRVPVGGRPNGGAFDTAGRLWFTDQGPGAIRRHDPATGETETVVDTCDGIPLGKPNDLAFDAASNLVFTCSNDARTDPVGYVCCMASDGVVTRIADGLYFPNGLAFSDNGARLFVAETYRHQVLSGAWDPVGRTWIDPVPWAAVGGPIGPDGMAFDATGHLHVAIFGRGEIAVLAEDGSVAERLSTPGARPTNLAFDPSGSLGLVMTETETGRLLSWPQRQTTLEPVSRRKPR